MQLSFSLMRRLRREDGGIAVKFAIIFPSLMILVFGVINFGHASYMRDLMSEASLADARYATRYQTDASGHRILPKNLSHSGSNYVLNTWGLTARLPDDARLTVTPSGAAATGNQILHFGGRILYRHHH